MRKANNRHIMANDPNEKLQKFGAVGSTSGVKRQPGRLDSYLNKSDSITRNSHFLNEESK
jgi:hypothetical protein